MIHKSEVDNYTGTMKELAEEIGNLKYDALASFLALLADKIEEDGQQDEERKRVKLSSNLYHCANKLRESKSYIDQAWVISEPYLKKS